MDEHTTKNNEKSEIEATLPQVQLHLQKMRNEESHNDTAHVTLQGSGDAGFLQLYE